MQIEKVLILRVVKKKVSYMPRTMQTSILHNRRAVANKMHDPGYNRGFS